MTKTFLTKTIMTKITLTKTFLTKIMMARICKKQRSHTKWGPKLDNFLDYMTVATNNASTFYFGF